MRGWLKATQQLAKHECRRSKPSDTRTHTGSHAHALESLRTNPRLSGEILNINAVFNTSTRWLSEVFSQSCVALLGTLTPGWGLAKNTTEDCATTSLVGVAILPNREQVA